MSSDPGADATTPDSDSGDPVLTLELGLEAVTGAAALEPVPTAALSDEELARQADDRDPAARADTERLLDASAPEVPSVVAARPPDIELRGPTSTRAQVWADAERLKVAPVVAHLLRARGICDAVAQQRAVAPRLADLRPPHTMAGFGPALEAIEHALRHGVRIGVFGDYDVDGVTTATILAGYLESVGAEVVVRVAQRERGYGFGVADAEAFVQARVGLVLTGDCGTSDIDALDWLRERGVPAVVIDHHQVPERMPPAAALINPHQAGCDFPFKGLCSAGVAFYLCAALRTRLSASRRDVPDPRAWLDLVALATVCDMMPLCEENRVLVHHGLREIGLRRRAGVRALLELAGVEHDVPLTEEHLGFALGPRINAPGRLGPADPALRLLRARTATEAAPLAQHVEALNAQRRLFTDRTAAEALALAAADPHASRRAAIVVAHVGWKPGIVGVAAARVAELHDRPALVLAIDAHDGLARGSVRSRGGVDVRAALQECSELLERFGGHREAAGATVRADRVDALREAFDAAVQRRSASRGNTRDVEVVDAKVPLSRMDAALVSGMRSLAPYGVGFPAPRLLAVDVRVEGLRVLKERHLRLDLAQGEVRRQAIAFGQAHHGLVPGERIDAVLVPSVDRFRGVDRLQLQIERLWRHVDGTGD